jgi:hypothetical protein
MSKTHVAFPYYMQDGTRLIYKGSLRVPVQMAEKLGRDGYVWAHYPELPKKAFDAKLAIDESYTYHAFNLRTQYAANGIYYLVFISPLHLKTFRDVIRRVYGTKPGRRRNRYPATGIFR